MASNRAAELAEVLWELKRAGKVATIAAVAERAGFSPGADGKAFKKCLATVRREWPHLDWFRAVEDDGSIEPGGEHARCLAKLGIEVVAEGKRGKASLLIEESLMMVWEDQGLEEASPTAAHVV